MAQEQECERRRRRQTLPERAQREEGQQGKVVAREAGSEGNSEGNTIESKGIRGRHSSKGRQQLEAARVESWVMACDDKGM